MSDSKLSFSSEDTISFTCFGTSENKKWSILFLRHLSIRLGFIIHKCSIPNFIEHMVLKFRKILLNHSFIRKTMNTCHPDFFLYKTTLYLPNSSSVSFCSTSSSTYRSSCLPKFSTGKGIKLHFFFYHSTTCL